MSSNASLTPSLRLTLLLAVTASSLLTGCASTTASSRPPRAAAPPITYFSMAAASMDRFEAWAEEMDLPVPELVQRGYIETNFPIIGDGGVRRDGPLAAYFSPRKRGDRKPTVTLAFPLTAGASPVEHLLRGGAQPVPGAPGVVLRRGFAFREADGFLLMGPDLELVSAIDVRPLAQRLARAGTLVEMDIDLARWRATDPATFHQFFNATSSMRFPFFDSTGDHMRLTLSDAGGSVRLSVELEPVALGESPTFPKPGFPAGRMGRVDFAYPSAAASRWMLALLPTVVDEMEKEKGETEKGLARSPAFRAMLEDVVDTLWTADAMSMAVEGSGSQLVYHQVNQYRRPAGFTARLNALIEAANRSMDKEKLELTSYPAGATTVFRVSSSLDPWTIDFVDTGTTVRMVIAGDGKRRLPDALALPAEGTISSFCAGTVNPGAVMVAFADKLPPSIARAMAAPLSREGTLSWTSRSEGKATVVDVTVTRSLARFLTRLGTDAMSKQASADH